MVHGREVGAKSHIIEIRICFGCAERRVDQFLVVTRQRNVPGCELLLESAKLSAGQCIAKPTRPAMRKETHTAIAQPENSGCVTRAIIIQQVDHLAFAKVIAATIRAKLADLFYKIGELIRAQPVETRGKRYVGPIMPNMSRVFTAVRPLNRNSQRMQYLRRSTMCSNLLAQQFTNFPCFTGRALSAARASRCAFQDGIDQGTADGFVRNLV